MKKNTLAIFAGLLSWTLSAQTAPPHLKYFGYAIIDTGHDDPNDTLVMTNYITEIDSFSNLAQLYVQNYTDTVIQRVNLMNSLCVWPILSVSEIFFYYVDANAPSGANYDLRPDYLMRWNTFKANNLSILDSTKIGVIYVVDEPTWNGIAFGQLDTVCTLLKTDYPGIPILFVEAWPILSSLQVPPSLDYIGFDHYGIFNVSTDSTFLAELDTLKSKRTSTDQKIFLVVDDQWHSGYGNMGWSQDTIADVVQHYYDLAVQDTDIIGLAGFSWPGLAPGWLGARNLPQAVIDKNVEIGQLIKANNMPCVSTGTNHVNSTASMSVFPNPAGDEIFFRSESSGGPFAVQLYSSTGEWLDDFLVSENEFKLSLEGYPAGLYLYRIRQDGATVSSGKFIRF